MSVSKPQQGIIPGITWKNYYKRSCHACNQTIKRNELITKSTGCSDDNGMVLRTIHYKDGLWKSPRTRQPILHRDCAINGQWTYWAAYIESFIDMSPDPTSQLTFDLRYNIKYYNKNHIQTSGYNMGCEVHNCLNCACYGCPCQPPYGCPCDSSYNEHKGESTNVDEPVEVGEPMDIDEEHAGEPMDIDEVDEIDEMDEIDNLAYHLSQMSICP
jgi:hypothetical protein